MVMGRAGAEEERDEREEVAEVLLAVADGAGKGVYETGSVVCHTKHEDTNICAL